MAGFAETLNHVIVATMLSSHDICARNTVEVDVMFCELNHWRGKLPDTRVCANRFHLCQTPAFVTVRSPLRRFAS